MDANEKIDLVYLWLDGDDKKWQRQKEHWLKIETGRAIPAKEAVSAARWRENDELKYALRSAEAFAPWINHIYIVTGFGQVPKWLNTKHPKITIVDHSQIMPADALPTFNSIAIVDSVVNIPDLSEHFLIANDDTFFGRPITPDYFYDRRGRTIVWCVNRERECGFFEYVKASGGEYRANLYYANRVFETVFGKHFLNIGPSHNIRPMRKSRIKELLTNPMIDMYYQKTIRSKFRRRFDLPSWIFTLYDIAFYDAVTKPIYSNKKLKGLLRRILGGGGFGNSPKFVTNAVRAGLMDVRPPLFCINDSDENTDQTVADNREFLETLLPNKSAFEK